MIKLNIKKIRYDRRLAQYLGKTSWLIRGHLMSVFKLRL